MSRAAVVLIEVPEQEWDQLLEENAMLHLRVEELEQILQAQEPKSLHEQKREAA